MTGPIIMPYIPYGGSSDDENKKINIGEVSFKKGDVVKSETAQKNGQTINTVFLKDGTKLSFPEQDPKNNAGVSIFGEQRFVYPIATHTAQKVTLKKLDNAEVTGTEKTDSYVLEGCRDSKVNVSQKDGKKDIVLVKDAKTFLGFKTDRKSSGNEVLFSDGDDVRINGKDYAGTDVSGINKVKE